MNSSFCASLAFLSFLALMTFNCDNSTKPSEAHHDTIFVTLEPRIDTLFDTLFLEPCTPDSIPYPVFVHDTTWDTVERLITRVDSAYFDRELIYPLYVDSTSFRRMASWPINSGDSVEFWGLDGLSPDTILRKNIRGGTYKVIVIDTVYQVVVRR